MNEERIDIGLRDILTLRYGIPYSLQVRNEACLLLSKVGDKWYSRSYVESDGSEYHYCVELLDGKWQWSYDGFEQTKMQFYPIGAEMQYELGHAFVSFLLDKGLDGRDKRQLLHCVLEDGNGVLMTISEDGDAMLWRFKKEAHQWAWAMVGNWQNFVVRNVTYRVSYFEGIYSLERRKQC